VLVIHLSMSNLKKATQNKTAEILMSRNVEKCTCWGEVAIHCYYFVLISQQDEHY